MSHKHLKFNVLKTELKFTSLHIGHILVNNKQPSFTQLPRSFSIHVLYLSTENYLSDYFLNFSKDQYIINTTPDA